MNHNLTETVFILDRSGSMNTMTEPTIAGFNQFLRDQAEAKGQARLTLVLFDDQYEIPYHSIPIEEVVLLDTTTFVPRGSTALLDAIGRSIVELGARLSRLPENERPGSVIVAILTDGMENASREYNWNNIQSMIRHQTEKYGWEFLFLGANQDGIATAAQMGIAAHNAATWTADAAGARSSSKAFSRKMSEMRARSAMPDHAASAPPPSMQQIMEEEDRNERRQE